MDKALGPSLPVRGINSSPHLRDVLQIRSARRCADSTAGTEEEQDLQCFITIRGGWRQQERAVAEPVCSSQGSGLATGRSWWCQNRSAGVWLEWSCSRSCPGMLCPSPTMVKWIEFHSRHFGALWAVRNWAQPGITPWIHLPFLDCFRTGLGSAEPACSEPWPGELCLSQRCKELMEMML